ncbi:hypothetical protein B0H17DRAFT_1198742 [Mycena rosella]|uniref:Uncharacterized protein n=1 Tax=Mycena rosella TaxID=1033263 RepID=A0AAD7DM59_MYCRO|nr:hypothetical protein B0H17DRAFT_1198742 [Mycena rosella]
MDQVRKVAERLCTADELALLPDLPDVCLNRSFHKKGIQQAFLSFAEDGVPYSLWIHGVFPSFDGSEPDFTIPPLDTDKLPCMKGLGDVKNRCIKWPMRHLCVPDWFYPRLARLTVKLMNRDKAAAAATSGSISKTKSTQAADS